MRAYAHGEGCLMQFLQRALDDPDQRPCGRCSVCTGELPAPGARPQMATVDAARRFFRGQDVVVEPRKQWVARLPDRKGKIAFMAPGRALAYADDPAWNAELGTLWQADRPAPQLILDALVQVLVRWSKVWERPVAVVGMWTPPRGSGPPTCSPAPRSIRGCSSAAPCFWSTTRPGPAGRLRSRGRCWPTPGQAQCCHWWFTSCPDARAPIAERPALIADRARALFS